MKSKLTLISAAAAVVQLASCNGNPLEDIDYNDPVFHALTETESGTKTVLGKEDNAGNVPIMWSSGDEIIVTGDSREKACSYYKTADKNTSAAEQKREPEDSQERQMVCLLSVILIFILRRRTYHGTASEADIFT